MDDALKKVQDRIKELPQDVRDAIMANDFEDRVATIGQSNRLHIDQIGELGDETMLVMLGFSSPETFESRLQANLHLYSEQASIIATAVNNEIFLPIRESMKKFQEQQKSGLQPAVPVPEEKAAAPSSVTLPPVPQSAPPVEKAPPIEGADVMLSQKTMSMPAQKTLSASPATPPAPNIGTSYKTDPYREPAE